MTGEARDMAGADERFESGAPAYAAYLQTSEGRLRLDIAWENLLSIIEETNAAHIGFDARHAHAEASGHAETSSDGMRASSDGVRASLDGVRASRRALDLGGGTGAMGLRFAALGWHVAIVDPSATMLGLAADAARARGVEGRVTLHQAGAERARECFAAQTFDAATCHNVLEYVPDARAAVAALAALVSHGGIVSLVARNRAGEAMRAALKARDLDEAERALAADMVNESLYGGPARLFDAATLGALATGEGLEVIAARGVRVVADYLPAEFSDTAETYARLLSFERTLGARPEFAGIARYTQIIARK